MKRFLLGLVAGVFLGAGGIGAATWWYVADQRSDTAKERRLADAYAEALATGPRQGTRSTIRHLEQVAPRVWRVELSTPRPYCGLIHLDRFQRLESGRYEGVTTVPC